LGKVYVFFISGPATIGFYDKTISVPFTKKTGGGRSYFSSGMNRNDPK
jgi:hypothetical protein